MGIMNSLLADAKKPDIPFGIHENCRITKIDRSPRKKKDGSIINLNGWTTFTKFDENGKAVAEIEANWFNIDPTKEHAKSNFIGQMEQFVGILSCFLSRTEIEEKFNFFEEEEIENKDDFNEIFEDKKTLASVHNAMLENYFDIVEEFLNDKEHPIRLKVVFSSNGRNLETPKYGVFSEPNSVPVEKTALLITDREKKIQAQSTSGKKVSGNKVDKNM